MAAVDLRIKSSPNDPVPHNIRNAPTKLMKDEGNGKGYIYPPDHGYAVKPQVRCQGTLRSFAGECRNLKRPFHLRPLLLAPFGCVISPHF